MTAKKRTTKKVATSPAEDDPSTPYYDARADDGTFAEEAPSAGEDDNVAPAPPDEPEGPSPESPSPDPTPTPRTPRPACVSCGAPAVYETDGRATPKRAFCKWHLPVNVTEAMLQQYDLTH